jgi:predicted alpha/beta hydrolase family esterase
MTRTPVLFIQGGGKGAHDEDASLAESLKKALGAGYELHYPVMPGEDEPSLEAWKKKIGTELSRRGAKTILVAHSIGGSMLLNYLWQEKPDRADIAGLFLLAAPAWDGDRWNFDDLKLPADLADKLFCIPRIHLYHCRDDEIVPFAHLALHAAQMPQAVVHAIDSGGHQFGNDMSQLAADIRGSDD